MTRLSRRKVYVKAVPKDYIPGVRYITLFNILESPDVLQWSNLLFYYLILKYSRIQSATENELIPNQIWTDDVESHVALC